MNGSGFVSNSGLERELLVVTVDIDTKERLVLRSGCIADAVRASCAMPGIGYTSALVDVDQSADIRLEAALAKL